VYFSEASDLVPGDTNSCRDVFVRDLPTGTTERVSLDSSGVQGNGQSGYSAPSVSGDGRYVVFDSQANNLAPGDTNGKIDIFLRDRLSGTTERVSVNSGGGQGNGNSQWPCLADDGRHVAFYSFATNLVPNDTNGVRDVFARDRSPGTGTSTFTSLCEPGSGSVIGCPCSNPSAGPDRGCDNSTAGGGAALSASGATELAVDGLVFTTQGQTATSLSLLVQGNAPEGNGLVYGQGVRCVGGALKRLFVKSAVGGSITAPDFGAGDPPVSVRSAERGDVIQPGQSRWYFVYYRDPVVLGGCPASSTFNATQTGRVDWSF
jgi:hypothetical protein